MSVASPFIKIGSNSSAMAAWAWLALLIPCSIYSFLYHPAYLPHLIGYSLLGSIAESIYTAVIKRKSRCCCMGSAFSAALLAASVPTTVPFLPMLFAILLMVWIVKLPMVGSPIRLNAAMTGRLFLMLVYPSTVVNWGKPAVDAISTATPQELYSWEKVPLEYSAWLFGKIEGSWEGLYTLVPGSPGETFPLLLIPIAALLIWKGIIGWRIPLFFVVSFSIMTTIFGNNAHYNLLSASTLFSAVFIVSDPVSTPMSKGGQIACGIIIGTSNVLIRQFTFYTEAIVYAVLIGNLCAPLLDKMTFELRGRILLNR